jgi:hypothetical protein
MPEAGHAFLHQPQHIILVRSLEKLYHLRNHSHTSFARHAALKCWCKTAAAGLCLVRTFGLCLVRTFQAVHAHDKGQKVAGTVKRQAGRIEEDMPTSE